MDGRSDLTVWRMEKVIRFKLEINYLQLIWLLMSQLGVELGEEFLVFLVGFYHRVNYT